MRARLLGTRQVTIAPKVVGYECALKPLQGSLDKALIGITKTPEAGGNHKSKRTQTEYR